MKFKNEQITREKAIANIEKIWLKVPANLRRDWYQNAHEFAQGLSVAIPSGNSLSKACGIIAALSPLKNWDENKKIATQFIKTKRCKHTKAFEDKCHRILASNGTDGEILSILSGNKISSFYMNIRHPGRGEYVTIDRHAVSIAMGRKLPEDKLRGITDNQYKFFEDCYKALADKYQVKPEMVQSVTWEYWRTGKE